MAQSVLAKREHLGEVQPGSTCSVPTNFRFAGMEWDDDLDLYHTWFRQYDTTQGRWMSVDPLPGSEDDPQPLNRYAYVLNDPVDLFDPLGLHPCPAGYATKTVNDYDSNGHIIGHTDYCIPLDVARLAGGGRGGWFRSIFAGGEVDPIAVTRWLEGDALNAAIADREFKKHTQDLQGRVKDWEKLLLGRKQ